MEEKKPLESKLTHTSKEPEAQLWAQIGTKAYDPPVKQTTSKEKITTTTTPSSNNPTPSTTPSKKVEPENNGISEEAETKAQDAADSGVGNGKATAAEDDSVAMKETETEMTVTQQNEKDPDEQPKEDSSKKPAGDSFDSSKGDAAATSSRSKSRSPERRRNRSRSRSRNRSRSRSPSNRRMFHDYVTNSNNPEDIRSRVFVGHLNTDKCEKSEVEELFKPHGKILGVTIQNGYGFVQYDGEPAVKDAIKHLHGTMFHDMKLVVDRPVALRKLEASRNRERKEMMDELEYLRRRDRDRREADKYYDRAYGRRDYYPGPPPPFPPPMPPQPYYGGDYGDRYGGGGGMGGAGGGGGDSFYGSRYGDDSHGGVGGGAAGRDDRYRGDDRPGDRYRDDRYRDDPYEYSYSQRGAAAPFGDPYGKPYARRM